MNARVELSGRDETLAVGLYTGVAQEIVPQMFVTCFEYTIRRRSLLDEVARSLGKSLSKPLPADHRALLERGEEQLPEDIALATRMRDLQRETLVD